MRQQRYSGPWLPRGKSDASAGDGRATACQRRASRAMRQASASSAARWISMNAGRKWEPSLRQTDLGLCAFFAKL